MPCRSDWPDDTVRLNRDEYNRLKIQIDELTRNLCWMLRKHKPVNKTIAAWWEAHKAADRARELKEQAKRAEEQKLRDARKKVKANFTKEELKLLGIKL